MTDERFVFNETNRERANLSHSAHKKCGGSRKGCKLATDHMTPKQLEKQHGPVITWKMNEFYPYDVFRIMPTDIQIEWVRGVMDRYHVGITTISIEIFNKPGNTLYQ